MVKTSFGRIPTIEQSERDVFITVNYNIFTIFDGSTEKFKGLHSVNCLLVLIVNFIYVFALLNGQELVL